MLDAVTLLFVTAIAVAFSGLLLVLAPGTSADSRTMRVWGASLLTGALGLTVSAAGPADGWRLAGPSGTVMFLLAAAIAWLGARLFAGRRVRGWWMLAPAAAWMAAALVARSAELRLALACWIGAAITVLGAVELWRDRRERLPSLPAVSVLMTVHALIYAARGAVAVAGGVPPGWRNAVMDGMVLESLFHAMGVAFLVVAMMKERADLRSREELRVLALSDGLTGIANRRHFDVVLLFEASRNRRASDQLALVMLDVDQFKRFNDVLGHPAGDSCLRAVAQALRCVVAQPGGLVARYGGEEFAILLPSATQDDAAACAEAARAAVEQLAIPHPMGAVVTISAGVAAMTGTGGVQDLLAGADRALYAAKAAGRNQVCKVSDLPAMQPSRNQPQAAAA